ncbi:MAG TPA: hypothetical protein VFO29_01520 [Candidatus Rubrimentiphilum sp.]|nr:hypothetical protein [Candidatus Rubrimentiphilum sp.]
MPFEVRPFNKDALYECLSNRYVSATYIEAHFRQPQYLVGYLGELGAKTIVDEKEYIDGDYLDDYASYYVRCFDQYGNRCRRLHFFRNVFLDADLQKWITEPNASSDKNLQKSYLGYVVVRPLPEAVIGRTALITYEPQPLRTYSALKEYKVSLFGIPLTIRSLAYQQQDTVVAACATVALWSAFHKTADLFQTPVMRPAAITNVANQVKVPGRAMPSHGLRLEQMCEAVRQVGLEPLVEPVGPSTPLLSIIHGYLEYELPIVLGVGVRREENGKVSYPAHAITIVGCKLADSVPSVSEPKRDNVQSIGSRIYKVYAHDDEVGPFARFAVEALPRELKPHSREFGHIRPPFVFCGYGITGLPETTLAPLFVLVPVYGKIRVTYTEVDAWAQYFANLLKLFDLDPLALEWDIHLTDTQRYKQLLREKYIAVPGVRDLIVQPQPRFIWRAVARFEETVLFEFAADATGLERSCPLFALIWHDGSFERWFKANLTRTTKDQVARLYTQRFADLIF